MKTALIIAGGIGLGLIVADIATDGAVRDAISEKFHDLKGKLANTSDVVADAAADVVDSAKDFAEDVKDVAAEAAESM